MAVELNAKIVDGDLASLTPEERAEYYSAVCQSIGLNPLTKPFDYIKLNGKLTLYAKRDATEQLRKINGISIEITSREQTGDLYVVQARATDKDGRTDESIGVVHLGSLKGEQLANALMKAETKAKRRVTLSLAGLGWLDETEVSDIPGAEVFTEGEAMARPQRAKPAPKPQAKPDPTTDFDNLRKRFFAISRELSVPSELAKRWAKEAFGNGKSLDSFNDIPAGRLERTINAMADKEHSAAFVNGVTTWYRQKLLSDATAYCGDEDGAREWMRATLNKVPEEATIAELETFAQDLANATEPPDTDEVRGKVEYDQVPFM